MTELSERVRSVEPSATFAIKARATEMKASGMDVVDLSAGEPDGLPPAAACEAGIAAIRSGQHRYSPVPGTDELRAVIADRYCRLGLEITAANIQVTFGGKQALNSLAQALLSPGDECIMLRPYWVSYPTQIQLTGATAVVIPTRSEDAFQPEPAAIEAAITSRTRVILLNSPNNPTGCIIEPERLIEIDRTAARHGIVVVSDEIYHSMSYDGVESICFPTLSDPTLTRTVVVDAVSKTFAMTGWRVGWLAGPIDLVKACARLQAHTTSGVSRVTQAAAAAALQSDFGYVGPIREALVRRRDLLAAGLDAIDGFEVGPPPCGAFYLFPRIDSMFGRTTPEGRVLGSGFDLAEYLLSEAGVAVVPGEAFGEPRCVRLSYAVDQDKVEAAVPRIAAAIARLS